MSPLFRRNALSFDPFRSVSAAPDASLLILPKSPRDASSKVTRDLARDRQNRRYDPLRSESPYWGRKSREASASRTVNASTLFRDVVIADSPRASLRSRTYDSKKCPRHLGAFPREYGKAFVYKAAFSAGTQNPTSLQARRYHVEQNDRGQ